MGYDFYSGEGGDYAFAGSSAAVTFTEPDSDGTGVMNVNYCFTTSEDNSNQMVAVQTGFAKDGIIPLKLVKYESNEKLSKIYNEYSFTGEYNCNSKTLLLGFTSYFEANAYTTSPAIKGDFEGDTNENGCF